MPLESTMICLDNSDWMRNGAYQPSRMEAQKDAAAMLCNDRINSNPENTVGILTMAGQGVDMLASPTEEIGKILACYSRLKLGGKVDLSTSIQIAQLALKHRKNKNGGQRIIIFVGGLLAESLEALQRIGKQLKKNNVAIDVISFGEIEDNEAKLQELVNMTNTNDNSHLLTVAPGVSLANALSSSNVMHLGGAAFGAGEGGAGGDFDMYGGIDPSIDPELAMALRVSAEEAKAAEESRRKAAQEQGGQSSGEAPMAVIDEDDEEAIMQRAIEMSMREMAGEAGTSAPASSSGAVPQSAASTAHAHEAVDDEEEELKRALALSMGGDFADPEFVNQLLQGADPSVQSALNQAQGDNAEGKQDDKSKKRKSDDK